MKSITIHGMDDALDRLIREKAAAEGKSLNKTIKGLLEESLGMHHSQDHRAEFIDLFGSWSEKDREQFEQATEDLNRVDPEDWE
jgi:hypothetical protein